MVAITTSFNFSWVVSGGVFGLLIAYYVEKKIAKSGKYRDFDRACKFLLIIGCVSCAALGIIYYLQIKSYGLVNK
jgi:uncharacterized membrane protein